MNLELSIEVLALR